MKFNIIFLLLSLIFTKPVLATGDSFKTYIQFDLTEFSQVADSLLIEVKLFNSFLGPSYRLLQVFNVPAATTGIDILLPEISSGSIDVKYKGKVLCSTGSTIFSGDSLIGILNEFKDVLVIHGGENDFLQDNFFLPFRLPGIISTNPSFKSKMVQQAYDLQISDNPMFRAIYMEYLRNVLSLVRQYPNSLHILNRLHDRADDITLKTLDTAITIFNEEVLNTQAGRKLKTYIANGKWLLNKPDLNKVKLSTRDGKEFPLGTFLDTTKFTYIDFWASWCVPCRSFNKSLVSKYGNLDTTKIQIVSISLDEDTQKWKEALAKDKLPWLNYIDPSLKGFKGDLASLFNIKFIPQSFLFDKNGNIVQMNISIEELMGIGK